MLTVVYYHFDDNKQTSTPPQPLNTVDNRDSHKTMQANDSRHAAAAAGLEMRRISSPGMFFFVYFFYITY